MIARSTNLRRLSFILYSSEKDQYVTQLPAIQEKLVDILRTTIVSPMVHSDVSGRFQLDGLHCRYTSVLGYCYVV